MKIVIFENSKTAEKKSGTMSIVSVAILFTKNSPHPLMLHRSTYENRYPETCEFLNNSITDDGIVGGHQNTERAYNTLLECIHIFKEAGMILHKQQTNSKALQELWMKEDYVLKDSSEIFRSTNVNFKVLRSS
ncbi:reverse transcriptase [Caerostris extrusa]|uniref:Reverse transcriptase n=1 Tax=Caerostris extrusa TaxID=172846 RepID=A0AAV4VZB2_CAEEX|nr:reverse transcriptase [Caerostris extrusa]